MSEAQPAVDADGIIEVSEEAKKTYRQRGYPDEVLPLSKSERLWGVTNYITVWMGPIHNILSYFTVVGFFALGLGAWHVVAAVLTAAVIVSLGYIFNGVAAAKYGMPFAMFLKHVFGVRGSTAPAFVRGFVAGFVFFGLTTIASGEALDVAIEQIYPDWSDLGGGAEFIGLSIPTMLSYLIMFVVTIGLYLGGQRFLSKFSNWSSPAIYLLGVIAVIIAFVNIGGVAPAFEVRPMNTPVTVAAFIACVSALVSNWAAPIVNIADFSRNAKSTKHPAIGYPIGMITSYIVFLLIILSFMASLDKATGGDFDINNPTVFVDAIGSINSPIVVILLIIAFNVGATAFCVFGNLLPSGLQLTTHLPKLFTVKTGGIITAIIGTLILPWKFVQAQELLFLFYSFIGSLFGPMAGIMLASYFFVRRGVVRLEQMYVPEGQHGEFRNGINMRAVSILVGSFIITMLGAVFTDVGFLSSLTDFAFFVGLLIGFFGYLIAAPRATATTA